MSLKEKKDILLKYWENFYNFDKSLLNVFKFVHREDFVLPEYRNIAYGDFALPIPANQTISQPTTIMLMMNYLELKKGLRVLEIGTGSGYQAALLGKIVGDEGQVYTVEIINELVKFSKKNLSKLKNVRVFKSDGSLGLKKYAPYDRILVTAGCPKIPKSLINQLKKKGILVAPVGPLYHQTMTRLRKNGKIIQENLGYFEFVPLVGKYGYKNLD